MACLRNMANITIRPDILYAWAGQSLLVVNTRGECGDDHRLTGYYFRESRFLRTLQLRINDQNPWRCEAASVATDTLTFTYLHPELTQPGEHSHGQEPTDADGVPERSLDVRTRLVVDPAHLDIHVSITNRATRPLTFNLSWILGADFADIQEAEGSHREQRARVETTELDGRELRFEYRHPQLPYRTSIRTFDARPWRMDQHRLQTDLHLASQECAEVSIRVLPSGTAADLTDDGAAQRRAAVEQWRASFTTLEVPGNTLAERILTHNVRDFGSFALLEGDRDEWLTPQAGMPLYPAFFGRDALTAGWQAALVDRGRAPRPHAEPAVRRLAR